MSFAVNALGSCPLISAASDDVDDNDDDEEFEHADELGDSEVVDKYDEEFGFGHLYFASKYSVSNVSVTVGSVSLNLKKLSSVISGTFDLNLLSVTLGTFKVLLLFKCDFGAL